MTSYFPIFANASRCTVLLFGGGASAKEKLARLSAMDVEIAVQFPEADTDLQTLEQEGRIRLFEEPFDRAESVLLRFKPSFCIIADAEKETVETLFALCRKHGVLVNTVDDAAHSTFIFPSVLSYGRLTVAVSTGGASPTAAKKIREEIGSAMPSRVDEILEWLAELREEIRERENIPHGELSALYRELTDLAFAQNRPLTREETESILARYGKEATRVHTE